MQVSLTAIDRLLGLLRLSAGIVRSSCLGLEASLGAVGVEVAVVVHGELQGVALPAEDVVTVGGRTSIIGITISIVPMLMSGPCWRERAHSPKVHAVHVWVGAVGGPHGLVLGELRDIPHDLVHDLGQLDGVRRRAGAAP